jgi:ABC-type proline/glycine betaine transport system permease subunit
MVNDDPVLARRARIARIAAIGKRVGYLALGVAIVSFLAGVITSFATWTVVVSTVGLVTACVVLPIPIVLGYGVRAAAREDRQRDAGRS